MCRVWCVVVLSRLSLLLLVFAAAVLLRVSGLPIERINGVFATVMLSIFRGVWRNVWARDSPYSRAAV